MDELSAVGRYFEQKVADWGSRDGLAAAHLRRIGRDGLVSEFRTDPNFSVVSRYLRQGASERQRPQTRRGTGGVETAPSRSTMNVISAYSGVKRPPPAPFQGPMAWPGSR